MSEQTINVNQNSADCIKAVLGVGSTTYQNICSGAVSVVPWGAGDWAMALGLGLFVLAITIVFAGMGVRILLDR